MAEGDRFNETLGHMVKFKGEEKNPSSLRHRTASIDRWRDSCCFFNSLSFLAHVHFII